MVQWTAKKHIESNVVFSSQDLQTLGSTFSKGPLVSQHQRLYQLNLLNIFSNQKGKAGSTGLLSDGYEKKTDLLG